MVRVEISRLLKLRSKGLMLILTYWKNIMMNDNLFKEIYKENTYTFTLLALNIGVDAVQNANAGNHTVLFS